MAERFCGVSRDLLMSDPNRELAGEGLEEALCRRCAREPLQYILGEWWFYRQTYEVSPACLIPRSDTEILVEEAISMLPQGAYFADFCTGSGCIAISTLAERPDTSAVALELSDAALEMAKRNALRNGVFNRLSLKKADVLHLEKTSQLFEGRLSAIFSNPPYIRTEVLETLEPEVKREPRMALDGGDDGLVFYRAILSEAPRLLREDGFVLFEIGYDQGAEICALAEEHGFRCLIRKDFGGCDRVAILRRMV